MPETATDLILDRLTRLHPKTIDLTLGRTQRLLDRLGNPERRLAPVIHVAGTNGKGSVIAFLRAMLRAAGYRVQTYTSPHLVDFRERISMVDGEIATDALLAILDECERVNANQPITFFEITTAAAFLAFSREPADITLVEVGLGGRFDSTNVIDRPRLTVITPISHDHHAFLGTTLAAIAAEKSGIIKANTPLIVGRQPKRARAVIDARARQLGAPVFAHTPHRRHRSPFHWSIDRRPAGFDLHIGGSRLELPDPTLAGDHQYDNAAQAAVCLSLLDDPRLTPTVMTTGLRTALWPGRLQRIRHAGICNIAPAGAEIWFDGGHNVGAARVLSTTLASWQSADPRPLFIIVGMIETKNPRAFLAPLADLAHGVATVPVPASTAGRSPQSLATILARLDVPTVAATSVANAVQTIADGQIPFEPSARAPRILITGSLYLAPQVLAPDRASVAA